MGLPEDMRDNVREIVSVKSTSQRKGHASALMHKVCAEADKWSYLLLIHVQPFADGMPEDRLERFYGKFGFIVVQLEPAVLMAREPVIGRMH